MNNGKRFKACDFCRYRKKKCVSSSPSHSSKCDNCQHLGVACLRSNRRMSLKRYQTSKSIAEKVLATVTYVCPTATDDHVSSISPDHASTPATFPGRVSPVQHTVVVKQQDDILTVLRFDLTPSGAVSIYNDVVKPFTPFLDPHYSGESSDINVFINIAAQLGSANNVNVRELTNLANKLLLLSGTIEYDTAVGALLVLGRIPLNSAEVGRVLLTIKVAIDASSSSALPDSILVGSYISSLWHQFLGIVSIPLCGMADCYHKLHLFSASQSTTEFISQYMIITKLLVRSQILINQRRRDHSVPLSASSLRDWLSLEYDFLLWSLNVPPNLIDLRDEMPGLAPSRIIHVLFNTVYMDFYLFILRNKVLQPSLHLKPVPAVLHFIRALGDSVFKCSVEVVDGWYLLSACKAHVAELMLALLEISESDNCRAVLDKWDDFYGEFPELYNKVQKAIGKKPWIVEKMDGYSVFWTFRDIRALHIEYVLSSGPITSPGNDG